MTLSYSAIWDDVVRLLKSHGTLLAAVAGVFLMLPELLGAYFYPRPEAATMQQVIDQMGAYVRASWPALLATAIAGALGTITMLLLLFDRSGALTVGSAIRRSFALLIPFIVATLLSNLLIALGFVMLLVPGCYLLGRLAPLGPVIVAEGAGPIDAIRRTFDLTRRRGWAVFGFIAIVFVAGTVLIFAVSSVIGAVLLLVAGERTGGFLVLVIQAALGATLTTVTLVVYAAIYRRLAAEAQPTVPRTTGI